PGGAAAGEGGDRARVRSRHRRRRDARAPLAARPGGPAELLGDRLPAVPHRDAGAGENPPALVRTRTRGGRDRGDGRLRGGGAPLRRRNRRALSDRDRPGGADRPPLPSRGASHHGDPRSGGARRVGRRRVPARGRAGDRAGGARHARPSRESMNRARPQRTRGLPAALRLAGLLAAAWLPGIATALAHEPLWGETPTIFGPGVIHPEIRLGYLRRGTTRDPGDERMSEFEQMVAVQYGINRFVNVRATLPGMRTTFEENI